MKRYFIFALICGLFVAACVVSGGQKGARKSPSAFLPIKKFEFAPVLDGVQIQHTFAIQNKGTLPLDILKVRTGWGCTAVSYSRQIPPGGEGAITIKIDTAGYGGRKLQKKAVIHTNDKKQPPLRLHIFGKVEKFATISPKRVKLTGEAGKEIKGYVRIIPEKKYPFKLVEQKEGQGKNISYTIERVVAETGEEYLLTVKNLKQTKDRYFETITIKTDTMIQPEIKIRIYGNITEPK